MTDAATLAGPLSVAWIADTEHVQAHGVHSGMLVLPEQQGDDESHRVYFVAPSPEHLAKLCALPIALALETGVWPLAAKLVRDNPENGENRHNFTPVELPDRGLAVSRKSRMLADALITAVAAGARSTDGSHVVAMASARLALMEHIARLERLAGR